MFSMNKISAVLVVAALMLALGACDQPDPERAGDEPPIQNPPVDTDPTPDTGTGGESQSNPP